MPVISVLIPCYNVEATVDEALSSLQAQSMPDFEVVLVDDGSSDGTLHRLQHWASKDQRYRVIAAPHRGIIPTLNTGLAACRSNFVARLDADDRATPDRLQLQVEMLTSHPETTVVTSLVRGFPESQLGVEFREYIDWLNSLLTDEDIKKGIFLQSPLAHPSVAYRRAWVDQVGGYQDHGWAEDYDLWLRLYLSGASFYKVPQVLLEWRDHPQRLTHTDGRYSKASDLHLKAYYLMKGPLSGEKNALIWGSDRTAHQLATQLLKLGCKLIGIVADQNIMDEKDAGSSLPVLSSFEFDERVRSKHPPCLLVAENDPQRKSAIIQRLAERNLCQGIDWWAVG